MKIAVGQEAKEAKNEEKEHAVIFTTGASGLMKPGKATEVLSISILESGNNRHAKE